MPKNGCDKPKMCRARFLFGTYTWFQNGFLALLRKTQKQKFNKKGEMIYEKETQEEVQKA